MYRKSLFLAASVVAGLTATSAFAQSDFNGPYVGAVVGYSDGSFDAGNAPLNTAAGSPFFGSFGGANPNSSPKFGVNGWDYGVTGGYNYQRGPWLTGVEADISASTADGDMSIADRPSAGTNRFSTQLGADVDYTATLRMRAGYVLGPVLFYGTAGAAAEKVKFNRDYRNTAGAALNDSDSNIAMALAYGGGAEWKFNDKLSVKAEYLFLDSGKQTYSTNYSDGTTGKAAVDFDRDLYRMGVNYRF